MSTSYDDYISKKHIANIARDAYYIDKIPADELNDKMCCAAMKKAAGDYEFFKWFLEKYPKFVDENLCKIAVSANPKKKYVRSVESMSDPDGTTYYDDEYKYFDPVIKYVPEKFRTVDVCIASAKYDWRTLQFVPVEVQMADQRVCETAVSHYHQIMTDDVDFSTEKREKIIFDALNKSIFEKFPNIFDSTLTLETVSAKWVDSNPDKVGAILLKHPEHIKKLPKDFRKNHFDVIRDVAGKNYEIWSYLSATEQQKLRDITRSMAQKHPEMLAYLYATEQKELVDLVETALKTGKIGLGAVKPSVQMLIPGTCVEKLTKDPHEHSWCFVPWAHGPIPGLNLRGLCKELQDKNTELLSELVCEHLELMKYVNTDVLIAHPEICVAAIEKFGAKAYEKIPQAVFDKNPDLYEQLLSKCPPLLRKFPKKIQTRDNWIRVLTDAPWLAPYAPARYVTIEHYKNAFLSDNMSDLSSVPPRFRTYEMCKIAVMKAKYNLDDVPNKVKKEHPGVCWIAITEYPYRIKQVPEVVQLQNLWLCRRAVTKDPMSLEGIKSSVKRKYPEICRLAMAQLEADFGWMDAAVYPEKLEEKKDTLRSYIPRDVLKEHWDYINNTRGVITVKKHR
ncbi:MAG: hypothetical protein J6Y07_01725 [Alphaproteobacteria bacterium]|nr:hypothetical protein [Alphaproteobacteria bacterium]